MFALSSASGTLVRNRVSAWLERTQIGSLRSFYVYRVHINSLATPDFQEHQREPEASSCLPTPSP